MPPPAPSEIVRFGDFELDVAGCELRRLGRRVKLGRQAMDVLILLVQRRSELVLRSEIVERLWGQDVFVDVETGINTAISKIRQALRDSAESPTFVETIPARGYRFLAPVDVVTRVRDGGLPRSLSHVSSGLGIEPAIEVPTPAAHDDRSPLPAAVAGRAPALGRAGLSTFGRAARLFMALAAVALIAGLVVWARARPRPDRDERVTLAVLPVDNVGSDPASDYLAAGLTQETSASLAQYDPDHVSVKGRTWGYKGTTKTAAEIGQELSVDYLVESTIRSDGSRLKVTATLLRVKDQEPIWSRSYEREAGNILGLDQELSGAIAEQIRGALSPAPVPAALRQTQNASAYDSYLKARYLESRRTPATNAAAIQLYERATTLDPDYALAWSSLAFIYTGSIINGDARPLDVSDHARKSAAQAMAANPTLAEAQFAAGYVNWLIDWDWPAAEAAFRRAIRLDPTNAAPYRTLGHALSQMGRHAEAAAAMQRTRELEPLESMSFALSSQVAFQARDYLGAVEYARRAVLVDSRLWVGYVELAQAYEQLGEADLALVALTDATRFSGGNSAPTSLRGYLLAKGGRRPEALEVLSRLEADARERYVPPSAIALVYAGLGESDEVFAWLDRAYAAHDVRLIYLPVDAKWDEYRHDPRFVALLRRCAFSGTTPVHN